MGIASSAPKHRRKGDIMNMESTPHVQRPSLDEYEVLYTQAEAILSEPEPDFKDVYRITNELKWAVRKMGLNPQKSEEQIQFIYDMYERAHQMLYRLRKKSQPSSLKRQPMLIMTTNEVDLYYLANSPLKRKADRVILPLSEAGLAQLARFEEKYHERKQQQMRSSEPKRVRKPLYSKHDLN